MGWKPFPYPGLKSSLSHDWRSTISFELIWIESNWIRFDLIRFVTFHFVSYRFILSHFKQSLCFSRTMRWPYVFYIWKQKTQHNSNHLTWCTCFDLTTTKSGNNNIKYDDENDSNHLATIANSCCNAILTYCVSGR